MGNSNAGTSGGNTGGGKDQVLSGGNAGGGKYQVFLNFCGRDTRNGFTDFLYQELVENYIHVFMDDEELRVGEEIGRELLQAIDDSQIYIPIFSRNYASSKWCLRELVRMVNNISKSEEKKILPIFYDVEPKDVDLKTSLYTTAIKKHKKKFPEEGKYWEGALQKIDKIKGWELAKCKSNAELMKLAVRKVLHQLKSKSKTVTKVLVGLDGPVREVLKLLDVNCRDVRLLGIYGMGGIGKTTLAKVIYNELHSDFGKCCAFLADVRETSEDGLLRLQKNLLMEIGSSTATEINNVDDGRVRIEKTLDSKKVLIVLDDVSKEEHIKNLIGQCRLQRGTRVIITTRNTSVLEFVEQRMARETKEMNSDHALPILRYEMKEMNFDDAFQIFNGHAFVDDSTAEKFYSLSKNIVQGTGGLPLALEVIGSFLFDKSKTIWEATSNLLKKMPLEAVQDKLMISYKALNGRQREIFLDIACFFTNEDVTNAQYMWEAYGLNPKWEIDVLVEMSLIKINDGKFWMHDQLRDLGREIVQQESLENRGKRSRLWTSKEFFERNEDVEALDLQGANISISHEEIGRFKSLRFLRLSNGAFVGDFIICLSNLRWISWHSPPPDVSVPSMHSTNLLVLELFDNLFINNSKVWDSLKMATKLKSLALVKCNGITETPDLSKCLALERLTFDNCGRLKVINGSITTLKCLLDLNITYCGRVEFVPDDIGKLEKLERFSLKRCFKVGGLPPSIGNLASLRKLDLSLTRITSLPDSIGRLGHLSYLNLLGLGITELPNTIEGLVELQHLCLEDTKIRQLPDSIGSLISLCTLDLSKTKIEGDIDQWKLPKTIGKLEKLEELFLCYRNELVGEIPNEIGCLSYLRVLDLCGTRICGVPSTITMLTRLSTLDLRGCDEITTLPKLPTSLVYLRLESCSLQEVPNLSELTNLIELFLSDRPIGPVLRRSNLTHLCDLGWIERLSKLEKLKVYLVNIAAPHPKDQDLCWQLPPSLLSLKLNYFNLTGSWLSNLKILSNLTLRFSRMQEIQLGGLLQLKKLKLGFCYLERLSIPSSLRRLKVYECRNMIEIQFLGTAASLEVLTIENCKSIGRMVLCGEVGSPGVLNQSESAYCSPGVILKALKKLEKLRLKGCKNLCEIQVIGTLSSLQDIYIEHCDAMEKLSGVSNLKNLLSLYIYDSPKLRFVEGLDELEFLRSLRVSRCPSLEKLLDRSNSKIPETCTINVNQCRESLNSSPEGYIPFKRYKKMARQGDPQPKANKEEAKMKGDAVEPDTKPQSPSHPSASSSDHEISEEPDTEPQSPSHPSASSSDHETSEEPDTEPQSPSHPSASSSDHETSEEPPIDNVRDGTLPENQNQMREQDSSPLSLDELVPPRTFCDRFKTCLAAILECVCNYDFPSVKAEIL